MSSVTVDGQTTISRFSKAMQTSAADEELLIFDKQKDETWIGWGNVIDSLLRWIYDPDEVADDDISPFDRRVLTIACEFATKLRNGRSMPLPLRVVPMRDGGVAFEWVLKSRASVSVRISPDDDVTRVISNGIDPLSIEMVSLQDFASAFKID